MAENSGKVAVVTGASAGIGAEIARQLAASGIRLVLTARREDRLRELAASLPGDVAILPADINDPETPERLLARALAKFGRVDILVNNAGILRVGDLDNFDLGKLAPMIATNFEAPVRASYVFARAMRAAGSGAIINISSIGAHLTAPGTGVYGGLKKALEMFTDALRVELAGSGVRVGLVAPGTTTTEIFADMKDSGAKGWDEYLTPLQPEDIARAIMYLIDQPARANVSRIHVYAAQEGF
jgi:NADP-dependent 3-hydroxy acid dehydrogenase YdfG